MQKTVTIPACANHEGHRNMSVTLNWTCPVCGQPRGEPFETISFDGSRRLAVSGWINPCGHIDTYDAVRTEAASKQYTEMMEGNPAYKGIKDAIEAGNIENTSFRASLAHMIVSAVMDNLPEYDAMMTLQYVSEFWLKQTGALDPD